METLPDRVIGTAYPGDQYSTPRDAANEPVHASFLPEGFQEKVEVPQSSMPVLYISLDVLFDRHTAGEGLRELLPFEKVAKVTPKMREAER